MTHLTDPVMAMQPAQASGPGATLTFRLAEAGGGLARVDGAPSVAAWEKLAGHLATERTLTPFPADALRRRWQSGFAALLLAGDEIGAYVSCLPVLDAATRAALAAADLPALPQIDVFESLSGWTAPDLRKHGISLALRHALLARVERPNTLFIGFTAGVGASPVLTRLGWQVMPWHAISYVGSLIENSSVDCFDGVLKGWRVDWLKPYDGPDQLAFPLNGARREQPAPGDGHDWDRYCHFWLSRPALARVLDDALRGVNAEDLCRWRASWAEVVRDVLFGRGWVPIVLE